MEAIGAPVRALNARTASMSATHSVSPTRASPLGAFSLAPFTPPAMKGVESMAAPSAVRRTMKPLPSFCDGLPLMFDTNQRSCAGS